MDVMKKINLDMSYHPWGRLIVLGLLMGAGKRWH